MSFLSKQGVVLENIYAILSVMFRTCNWKYSNDRTEQKVIRFGISNLARNEIQTEKKMKSIKD